MSRSDANLAMIQPVFRPSRPAQYWNTSLPAARHSTAVSLQDAGGYTLPHVLRNGNPDLGHGVSLKSIGTGRTGTLVALITKQCNRGVCCRAAENI